jgi:hypothetical protein
MKKNIDLKKLAGLFLCLLFAHHQMFAKSDEINSEGEKILQEAIEIFKHADKTSDMQTVETLPIVSKQNIVGGIEYSLAISQLVFSEKGAEATFYGRIKTPDKTLFFGPGEAILSYENGVINETKLFLIGDVNIPVNNGQSILTLRGAFGNNAGTETDLTAMILHCQSYEKLYVSADISDSKHDGQVSASLYAIAKNWNDMLASVPQPDAKTDEQENIPDEQDISKCPCEPKILKSFIAYPNPSKGQFTAKIELDTQTDVRLRLVDVSGSIVDEREAKGNDHYEIHYDVSKNSGVYFLQLSSDKINKSLKLLINSH